MVAALQRRAMHRATQRGVGSIASALDELREAGREAIFVFSEGEPLLREMREEGLVRELEDQRWPQTRLEIVRGPGHTFRPAWSQALVSRHMDRALGHMLGRTDVGAVTALRRAR